MNPVFIKLRNVHVRRPVGFTLVEMALVVGLIGLLAYLFLPLGNTLREEQQRKQARAKLEAIDAALIRYVMLNNRLPCPADGALADTDPNYGAERNNGATATGCVNGVENRGVVPWRTLGLPMEAAIDPWGNWVTYRPYINGVSSLTRQFTSPGGACGSIDPPFFQTKSPYGTGSWYDFLTLCSVAGRLVGWSIDSDTTTANCDARVADPSGPPGPLSPKTGAAYILISHGANRCGAYMPGPPGLPGVYMNTCTGTVGMGVAEQLNRNNNAPLTGNPTTAGQCYKDGPFREKTSAQPFDDIVLWRTVMQVAVEAKKVQ